MPYRGGNCNNGANCGAFYVNLNNDAGNANWNIGASLSVLTWGLSLNTALCPCPLAKINSYEASVSRQRKRMRG